MTPRGAVLTPLGTPALQANEIQPYTTSQAKVDGKKHAQKFIEDFFSQSHIQKANTFPSINVTREVDNKNVQMTQQDLPGEQNGALLTPTRPGKEHNLFNAGAVPRSQRGRPLFKTLSDKNLGLPKSNKKVTSTKKPILSLKQRITERRRTSSLKRNREGPAHSVDINKRTRKDEEQVCNGREDDIKSEPPLNSDNYPDEKYYIVDGIIKEILSRIRY